MIRNKTILTALILLFVFTNTAYSQKDIPKDYFRSPIDFPIKLSGTFGELRKDHFHSGIDIKTNGSVGKKIYSIADGYVCRIKISSGGFGKAIYITHPNGYVSVYAHLNRFSKNIQKLVLEKQYKNEEYEVSIFPGKGEISVKKGEIIAFSGNSGGSEGPHLHFEIREEKSEYPVNPLLYGIIIDDYFRPKIKTLKIYPMNKNSLVNNSNKPIEYKIEGWGEKHRLHGNDTIKLSGDITFGIETYDLHNDLANRNGIYSVGLYVDSVLCFSYSIDKFSFNESRYINSLIDFADYIKNKRRIQKSFIEPNNKLSIYDSVLNSGVVNFIDTNFHEINYVVKDAYNNTSKLNFTVKSNLPQSIIKIENIKSDSLTEFCYDVENRFETENMIAVFPSNSFYSSFRFNFKTTEATANCISKIFHIHNKFFPVHKRFKLSIKLNSLSEKYHDKAVIVKLKEDEDPSSYGGEFKNGYIETFPKSFGKYTVMLDTIPPEIKALNIHNNKKISGYKAIVIEVTDKLSGINTYRGTLNGKWILMEYDAKNDKLTYFTDYHIKKGKNVFKLKITDKCWNESSYKANVIF